MVVAKFENTTEHGAIEGKTQTHLVDYYNLDMIISIGYRVKSDKGIIFRKWANKILKDYMLKGYAVNQRRLEYLEKTIKLIDIANRIDERLEGNDAKEILKVIGDYSKALDLLDDYDHRTLKKIDGNIDERKIEYKECIEVINKLRFNEESSLFAVERDKGLESIIGNIYQSFGGQDIYKSIEEKGANFLYLNEYPNIINSRQLYNRCHLIAWQLSAENNRKENLITGTAYLNQAMIDWENDIAEYVKKNEKDNYHVLYRVTPIFEGENKLASGVNIEAMSVEEREKGIYFNIYIYNVQPNIEIDYETGQNYEKLLLTE